jgi:hypothetical protein
VRLLLPLMILVSEFPFFWHCWARTARTKLTSAYQILSVLRLHYRRREQSGGPAGLRSESLLCPLDGYASLDPSRFSSRWEAQMLGSFDGPLYGTPTVAAGLFVWYASSLASGRHLRPARALVQYVESHLH